MFPLGDAGQIKDTFTDDEPALRTSIVCMISVLAMVSVSTVLKEFLFWERRKVRSKFCEPEPDR